MRVRLAVLLLSFAGVAATPAAELPPAGGGAVVPPREEISAALRERIAAEAEASRRRLRAAGELRPAIATAIVPLAWPLRSRALGYFGFHATSNFVDQDPAFPNQLLDFECGARTYDTAGGYNHAGVDLFSWPFWWNLMDAERVEAVAAAAGTIVARADGNFDRRCACLTDDPNYVIVDQADGSDAWYLHLKNGSVTPKPVGATVAQGEYLGVVGSSGCSTGPHLHFEVHDDSSALVDPYDGPCNGLNPTGWWAEQPPYWDPAINELATHDAPPEFPACPAPEVEHRRRLFADGATVHTVAYYRDQQAGQQTLYRLLRPDGSTWQEWSHASPTTYAASYWYWSWTLAGQPSGRWLFRAELAGVVRARAFWLGAIFADDFESAGPDAWSSVLD